MSSSRPEIPPIGTYNDPVLGTNTTSKFGPCDVELDCPIYQYCYTTPEYVQYEGSAGSCDCYMFYGSTGTECQELAGGIRVIFPVMCVIFAICMFSMWSMTLYQLIKVKAFKPNSASGHVLVACMIANFCEILMPFAYVLYGTGMDTTYKSHDILRGLSFGLCVVFKMAGIFEVPIMWMDIVIRSPGMNTDENKTRFKKLANTLRASSIIIGFLIIFLLTGGFAPIAAMVILLVLIICIAIYQVSARKLAIMICKDFFELGYKPDESKFASSADKSGHNAAKNIMLVSNKFSGVAAAFVMVMVGYSAMVRAPDSGKGTLAFTFIHIFIFILALIQNIFRDYVRLGARKKLTAAGYMNKGSKVTTTTTTHASGTTSVEGL